MIAPVADSAVRHPRAGRSESRESVELRALKARQPELADAVDMHLELLEIQRRVQPRIPFPCFDFNARVLTDHQTEARPLLRFEDIPIELTDLRLVVRQTAEVLRRFDALDEANFQKVQTLGRDTALLSMMGDWYRSSAEKPLTAPAAASSRALRAPGAATAIQAGTETFEQAPAADSFRPASATVAAPGLLSTTMGWPRCFSMALATTRLMTSVSPPAAHGIIILTGRSG